MDEVKQRQAAIAMTRALAEAIRDLKEVPAGHLYAQVMGHLSLETFESIIGILVGAGLVTRAGSHMLTWTGPTVVSR